MDRSTEVAQTLGLLYAAMSHACHDRFDGIVSPASDAMAIGTDRWLADRETWRAAFPSLRGISVESSQPQGFRDGSFGWAVDRPVFVLPDGDRLPTRLTAVAREEHGGWRVVHIHISVQVPDEVATAEAEGWTAPGAR